MKARQTNMQNVDQDRLRIGMLLVALAACLLGLAGFSLWAGGYCQGDGNRLIGGGSLVAVLLGATLQWLGWNRRDRTPAEPTATALIEMQRAALEAVAEGILVLDGQGSILFYNQKFIRLWQLPPTLLAQGTALAEWLQVLAQQTIHPTGLTESFLAPLTHGLTEPICEQITLVNDHVIECSAQPFQVGSLTACIWSCRDITHTLQAFKQVEDERCRSEERFRLAVKYAPDVCVIYDAERRIQYINERGLAQVQRPLEQVLGQRDDDLFPSEVTADYVALLQKTVETRRFQTGEYTVQLPNQAACTFVVKYVPLLDSQGEIQQILGFYFDITERKQMEEALHQSQWFPQKIANMVPQMLYLFDLTQRTSHYLNTQSIDMIGYTPEEICCADFQWLQEHFHPDNHDLLNDPVERFADLADDAVLSTEYRFRHKDGDWRWLYTREVVFSRDEQGRPTQVLGAVQDITQRKQAELALQDSEAMFRSLFELAAMGICLVDANGQFVRVNQKYCDILGYSAAELLQLKFQNLTHPDDLTDNTVLLQQLVSGETNTFFFEKRYIRKNQTIVWVRVTATVLQRNADASLLTMAMVEDISDRKQMEASLRYSEARLRLITDALPVCISYVDAEQRYQFANKTYEEWYGCDRADILGRHLWEVIGEPAYEIVKPNLERILAGEAISYESYFPDRSGGGRYISGTFIPDIDAQGAVVGFHAMIQDITQRQETELALRASEQKYRHLVNNLPAGLIVHAPDTSIVLCNPKACELLEVEPEAMMGTLDPASTWQFFYEDGTELALDQHPVNQVIRAQKPVQDEVIGYNCPLSGRRLWALVKAFPEYNHQNELQHVVVMFVDITEQKHAEQTLRDQELRLRLALEAAEMGTWECSLETGQLQWSERTIDICGLTPNTFGGDRDSFLRLLHPEDYDRVCAAIAESFATRSSYRTEFRILRPEGLLRWVASWGTVFWDTTRQSWWMTGVVIDITERKQAEEALQRSEQRYRLLFNSSNDAIFVHRFDDQGRPTEFIEVNDVACHLLGYSRAELLQMGPEEVNAPEAAQRSKDIAMTLRRERYCLFEMRLLTKQGQPLLVELNSRMFELDGQPTVLSIVRDIGERKQTELRLQQQAMYEQLLRTITQNIHQSLHLDQVLATAVREVRLSFRADRALIFRIHANGAGQVIKESVAPEYPITEQMLWLDECFPPECYEYYQQGQPRIVLDAMTDEWGACLSEFMQAVGVQSKIVAPITQITGPNQTQVWGLLIVHACAFPRQWQPEEAELLQQISHQLAIAIQHADLHQQLEVELQERSKAETAMQVALEREQQLREREHLISNIAQNIRQYLELDRMLSTTVEEIRQFLQVERVVIHRFNPDWSSQVTAESVLPSYPSILGQQIEGKTFAQSALQLYQRGNIYMVDDVLETELDSGHANLLQQSGVRAVLVIPVLVRQQLWGLIVAHQCSHPRQWQQVSWHLLRQLSTQLAIGIYQAELYQQVQRLNSNLEDQVQARTAQLRSALHYESVLKRITDAVRDSLDETNILQTAVRELALAIGLGSCNAALYDADRTTATVHYDYTTTLSSIQGVVIAINDFPEGYHQLLQGQYLHFCQLAQTGAVIRPAAEQCGILAYPIVDDQEVLGDIWLYKADYEAFTNSELHLVQQVANHCAIALRQSHLYQASQAQVKELERLNLLKDEFLSTVSHELRTPMSNIKMATQMLGISLQQMGVLVRDNTPPTKPIERYFQILRDECQRETNLINDLLDLARVDAGTEPLMLTPIRLQDLIPHIAEPFAERTARQKQQLQVQVAPNLPLVHADISYVERIVMELLNNACKYTPVNETIQVTAVPQGDGFQICVSNTGVDIPVQERDRIFEKFYRIPKNDPWKYGGTGLGLALVRKLAERMGGSIAVSSGDGQTRFSVYLPFMPPSEACDVEESRVF